MTLVIGLIGKISSGKGEIAKHLVQKYQASTYRFSDVLKDLLVRLHQPDTRENLQGLGVAIRKALGDDILAKALRDDLSGDGADIVLVDGIRYENEAEMVKSFDRAILVYVAAPIKLRYDRAINRGTRGENNLSFEQFKASDENETEVRVEEIGAKADITIENTGTLEQLHEKVNELVAGSGLD